MPFLIGIVGIAMTILYFAIRANNTAKAVKELDSDTKGLQRQIGSGLQNIFGTKLERVRDPRLAAAILMIQLVRTGSPVTAQERTQILEILDQDLHVQEASALFARAWSYTTPRAFFSTVSDQLTPLLREKLDLAEKEALIDMLTRVAGSYSDVSELQGEGITRFKRRLMMA